MLIFIIWVRNVTFNQLGSDYCRCPVDKCVSSIKILKETKIFITLNDVEPHFTEAGFLSRKNAAAQK